MNAIVISDENHDKLKGIFSELYAQTNPDEGDLKDQVFEGFMQAIHNYFNE